MRRITDLKSKLQRTNPVEHADRVQPHVRRAGRAGEHRRTLRELAMGTA